MKDVENAISEKRNSLKTDRLDMSFGEIMNMYEDKELFIAPEYQRVFRWQPFQQTRFLESVLLGIPIPPIFVAEDANSKWEVVDGLQRISTIFSFFGLLTSMPEKNNLVLTPGELVPELEGLTSETISVRLKTTIKRAVCRVEIVRWDSREDIRYELFNRLNTGSTPLSDQEIRNCIFRGYSVDLNKVLREIAAIPSFIGLISTTDAKKEEMFLEELALRFFAFKHFSGEFRTTVPQFLTEFMRNVSNGSFPFDVDAERAYFIEVIEALFHKYGKSVFRPKGAFAMHIFDSVAYALPKRFPVIRGHEQNAFEKIEKLLADPDYADIGTNAFSNTRIRNRMTRALEIFNGA